MSSARTPEAAGDVAVREDQTERYVRRIDALERQVQLLEWERQKFNAMVERPDAAFLLTDGDGRVIWVNRTFRDKFASPTQAIADHFGKSCHQLVCGKSNPCADCPVARATRSRDVAFHEFRKWVQREIHYLMAVTMPVFSSDGELRQAITMLTDVSELGVVRRSEEALRLSEERFRSVFQRVPVGMTTNRIDGAFLQVNAAFCTMLGHRESELLRGRLFDVLHPEDHARYERDMSQLLDGSARAVELERRYRRRDGTLVWGYTTSVVQLDHNGKPVYTINLIQDLTARKQAMRELRKSQRDYGALVNSIDGIVWEADPETMRFTLVSERAEEILGFPTDRWLAQPRFFRNRIHPEDLQSVVLSFERGVAERKGFEIEYRMIAADGRVVWLRDTVSMVAEDGKVVKVGGVMVDVTERRRAEEALQRSQEQLRQSQKMEAIGRLAGGIAHDFNNLLTAITGYTELVSKRLGGSHPLQREVLQIGKAAQSASDLTRQLLAFSRQQVLQPKLLDLNDVVSGMELMLRRVIGEDVDLVKRTEPLQGAVKADPGQLEQVVLNLAVNARDAMPEGGRLTIDTGSVDIGADTAGEHEGLEPGSYILLRIRDTGSGMDEQTKQHLFEPFFTTKGPGKGTGLGLSTVYGIVKQSGGFITVDSAPGEGSTFTVYLPRFEPATAGSADDEAECPEPQAGTETILLVEDDDQVRQLSEEILQMSGYTVITARDGLEALAICESQTEPIDLIVTDLVMPRLGGRELARRVETLLPDMRVLYLSGYTDSAVLKQGLLESHRYFLQKPFTPSTLANKVREVLEAPR